MQSNFDKALRIVTGHEGDYSNHKADPGGKTTFGVTEAVAREHGYEGPMEQMSKARQRDIAYEKYWRGPGLHKISKESGPLAAELFEIGFNVGSTKAIRWLQEWLNGFNRNEKDWDNISEDGVFGPETAYALGQYLGRRQIEPLIRAVNASQLIYYKGLARRDPSTYSHFLNGWVRQRGEPILSL